MFGMDTQKNTTASPALSGAQFNIGIIDDDPIAALSMRHRLNLKFPECTVNTYLEPIVTPMLDIYFVDNDFNGQAMATALLREIRELNPNALVVVMSSTLDNETLQKLMNGGCNAVYDKARPHDGEAVFDVIANYMQVLTQIRKSQTRNPFGRAITSLSELLKQWNQRLSNAGL